MWGGRQDLFSKCATVPVLVPKCLGSRQSCRQLPAQGWWEITTGRAEHQPGLAMRPGRECQPWGFGGAFPATGSSLGLALWQGW